jgi:hypothetical protein
MNEIGQRVQTGRKATEALRGKILNNSVSAYFGNLGDEDFPSTTDLEQAGSAAHSVLQKELLSKELLSKICSHPDADEGDLAALELQLVDLAPVLQVPPPQCTLELSPKRMALAAAVGAVAGMLMLAPLTRILLDMRDVGLFVGPPIGAFVLVLAVWYASRSKWLKGILMFALGCAVVGEAWQILSGGGLFSSLWRKLGGRGSAVKRVFLYIAVIFVLVIAKCRPRYNPQEYRETVRSVIAQWLDGVLVLLIWLCYHDRNIQEETNLAPAISELGDMIQALHHTSKENLPVAVEELILEAKNQGFEGLDGPSQFRGSDAPEQIILSWTEDLRERYDVFGHVEPGDDVIVQIQPVTFNGAIRKKGSVRKKRKGR